MVGCITLASLFIIGQQQCEKLGAKLDGIVLSQGRGGAWIMCYNPHSGDTMYFGSVAIKEKCIKL